MKDWLLNLFKNYFFTLFPFVVVFTGSLYNPTDSDLGWHLKYGEYFFNTGTILRENIYSTEMVGYPWVNSSWATDLITFFIFDNFGFLGLTLAAAAVVTAAFYFIAKAANLSFWQKAITFPLLVYLEQPLILVSFRGHLITLLFISVLYLLLSRYEKKKEKLLFFTIPLFSFWSNLHGEFILGLGLFILWSIFFIIKNIYLNKHQVIKKVIKSKILLLSLFFSSLATFINPFGVGIYQESFRHFGNPLQKYIIEWLPFDTFSYLWWNLIAWGLLLLASLVIMARKKKIVRKIHYIMPAIFLFILSLWMRRYTWPMYLISIPVVSAFFAEIMPKKTHIYNTIGGAILIALYLYIVYVDLPPKSIFTMNWDRYCYEYVGCSPKAAEFIKEYQLTENLMTFYNWGGWLIFNYYPEIKPSIDGRMHLWQDEQGLSAFVYYYPFEQNWQDVDKSKYDVVLMTPNKPIFKRLTELSQEGKWEIAYQDNYAYIFVRKR